MNYKLTGRWKNISPIAPVPDYIPERLKLQGVLKQGQFKYSFISVK